MYIPSYTPKYLYIPSYIPMHFKISNIRNMRANIKHKNYHISDPERPQGSESDTKVPTMSPEALVHPAGTNLK